MTNFYFEERPLDETQIPFSRDLAHHLYAHQATGKVAIVAENPASLLAAMRKQWMELLRQVQRERSSTLKAGRIMELSTQIYWMEHLVFTSKVPASGELEADVSVADIAFFAAHPPVCTALYVTHQTDSPAQFKLLTSNLLPESIVVQYTH